jgi:hypothetical protein
VSDERQADALAAAPVRVLGQVAQEPRRRRRRRGQPHRVQLDHVAVAEQARQHALIARLLQVADHPRAGPARQRDTLAHAHLVDPYEQQILRAAPHGGVERGGDADLRQLLPAQLLEQLSRLRRRGSRVQHHPPPHGARAPPAAFVGHPLQLLARGAAVEQ